jgi:hypothetical protein
MTHSPANSEVPEPVASGRKGAALLILLSLLVFAGAVNKPIDDAHGLKPTVYNALVIAAHTVAALALFGTLAKLFPSEGNSIAFAIAAFWMVNPLILPVVTRVENPAEVLTGMILLLGFYGLLATGQGEPIRRWKWVCLVLLGVAGAAIAAVLHSPFALEHLLYLPLMAGTAGVVLIADVLLRPAPRFVGVTLFVIALAFLARQTMLGL